jgi:hypothetical protein
VFKGPVLAEQVYGDLSLREFMDLDLFVREQDVRKAEQILTAGGYTTYMAGEAYRSAFLSYYGQQPFIHANTGVVVDLHWRLASKNVAIPIEPVDLWKRLQNVTLLGRPLPTLAPPDLVLFLAAHGSMHGWGCLIWVCDIAEFLRKHQKVDWDAIFKLATRSHSVRPLLSGIFLAHTLLDAPVPGELLSKARTNSAVQTLAEKARLKMHRPVPHGDFAEFLHGLSTHDLVRDRLWPVATLLLTRTVNDHQAMPLPKSLWGMYHLTRPFRLAGKAAQMFKAVSD